ncbi:MAG: filamentous hemagglutinin N-terminal domain-containing protein, partial [Verrucomicrobiota bacterium]
MRLFRTRKRTPTRFCQGCAILLVLLTPGTLKANPTGGQVTSGQATFVTNGNTLNITTSDQVSINWQNFSIASGETTQFFQPGSSSLAVNRVVTGNPSALYGTLRANGQIMLINPNGIVVGAGGVIDTGGFYGSTLDLPNNDIFNGNWEFSGGQDNAIIENFGTINANGGDVVLISREVNNAGTITAPNGKVSLAAGKEVLLARKDDATQGIYVRPEAGSASITNSGTITAMEVEMEAAGGNPYAFAIQNTGTVRALGFDKSGGRVRLLGHEGLIKLAGEIKAGIQDTVDDVADTVGGLIEVTAPKILVVEGTTLEASGLLGGGKIYIGGNQQGQGPLPNAQNVVIEGNTSFEADAIQNGDGGEIIVFAEDSVEIEGTFSARGGSGGGDGGFIEASGKNSWLFSNWSQSVDVSAANGNAGLFLIDPVNINIVDAGLAGTVAGSPTSANTLNDADIVDFLENTGSLQITTNVVGADPGVVDVASAVSIIWTSGNDLQIDADSNILLNAGAVISATGAGGITFNANIAGTSTTGPDAIRLEAGSMVQTNSGAINFTGSGGLTNSDMGIQIVGGTVSSNSGSITLNGTGLGGTTAHGIIIESAGQVTSATGTITLNGTGSTGNGSHGVTILGGSQVASTSSSNITINAVSQAADAAAAFDMSSGANIVGGASATGDITINADSYEGGSGTIQSDGNLVIAPTTASTTIGVGTGTGTLSISAADVAALADGFNSITIGSSTSGAVDVDAITFTDNVTINGNSIAVTGLNAGTNTATLAASGGAITDGGDLVTDVTGSTVTLNAAGAIGGSTDLVSVAADSLVTDTSGASGNQFISETDGLTAINLNAGGGNIGILSGGAITDTDGATDITAADATLSAAGNIGTSANPINTAISQVAAQATAAGDIHLSNTGALTVTTLNTLVGIATTGSDIGLTATGDINISSNLLARNNGNITVTSGGIITTTADVKSVAATTGSDGDGSGNITLTADSMTLTSGSISATGGAGAGGTLTLAPQTASSSIGLGGGTGTLQLDDSEIALFADGFASIVVGLAAGTGAVDLEGFTANDPVTIAGGASLTGPDDGNTYTINAADGGTIDGFGGVNLVTWANIGAVTGGTGNDIFNFVSGGSLSGNLSTGTGTNSVNFTDAALDLTGTLITGNLSGGGTDTLSYANQTETININLHITSQPGVGGTVSSIESFIGGAGTGDTFTG